MHGVWPNIVDDSHYLRECDCPSCRSLKEPKKNQIPELHTLLCRLGRTEHLTHDNLFLVHKRVKNPRELESLRILQRYVGLHAPLLEKLEGHQRPHTMAIRQPTLSHTIRPAQCWVGAKKHPFFHLAIYPRMLRHRGGCCETMQTLKQNALKCSSTTLPQSIMAVNYLENSSAMLSIRIPMLLKDAKLDGCDLVVLLLQSRTLKPEAVAFGAPQVIHIQRQSCCAMQPLLLLHRRSDLALGLSHTVNCPLSKPLGSLITWPPQILFGTRCTSWVTKTWGQSQFIHKHKTEQSATSQAFGW